MGRLGRDEWGRVGDVFLVQCELTTVNPRLRRIQSSAIAADGSRSSAPPASPPRAAVSCIPSRTSLAKSSGTVCPVRPAVKAEAHASRALRMLASSFWWAWWR